DDKIIVELTEAKGFLAAYRDGLEKLVASARAVEDLVTRMSGSAGEIMLVAVGTLLGALLAVVLGRGISRPMTVMCKAMRELAAGNFDVVLPGLGRRDELGEMASAVEEFKVQAIA